MEKKNKKVTEGIEETMACTAFAEAGEPCPINTDDTIATAETPEEEKKPTSQSIENTMACTAFAEAGEPCPIDSEEKPIEDTERK